MESQRPCLDYYDVLAALDSLGAHLVCGSIDAKFLQDAQELAYLGLKTEIKTTKTKIGRHDRSVKTI